MTRKPYDTDLTGAQWEHLEPLLPKLKSGTRKGGRRAADLREVVNALACRVRAGRDGSCRTTSRRGRRR